MTTRKHFARAAEYIKSMTHPDDPNAEALMEGGYRVCVDLFQSDNPRFDVERFRLACGLRVDGPTEAERRILQGPTDGGPTDGAVALLRSKFGPRGGR